MEQWLTINLFTHFFLNLNMPPPSPLSIATGSVLRLVKEETSYQKEMQQQQSRISKLEQGDGADENADFILKQEVWR